MKWTSPPISAILVGGDYGIKEEGTMNEDKTTVPTINTAAMPPVANMDETDWTAMLMEMRILSA